MFESMRELFKSKQLRRRLILITSFMILFHLSILVPVLCSSQTYPNLFGLALLAYGLGLRHAVDPDHIAAIDNTTRKLMQDGKKPIGVGFFFAMGHSTIVIAMCVFVAISASFLNQLLPAFRDTGALISASVSCAFLLAIGFINLVLLVNTFGAWQRVTKGGAITDASLAPDGAPGGLLARILRPVLKMVGSSWNMYWVGLLFGLGFDTASEVALLGISGSTGSSGMPIGVLLLVPLAFTAGMSLIDSLDGILMLGAYGWALLKPERKLFYNMTITLTSVVVALLIGGVEGLQIVSKHTGAKGGLWDLANQIKIENWGFYMIGIFMLCWLGSMFLNRRAIRRKG